MRCNSTGLTGEHVKHDREEGFVVVPELFDREDLRATEEAITDLTERAVSDPANLAEVLELEPEPAGGTRIPLRIHNPSIAHEGFRSIAPHEKANGFIEDLGGPTYEGAPERGIHSA
jgi:hypothetical protein